MATLTPERTFHNYYDVERIPYRYGTGSHEVTRHFLVQERSLKYDFFLHMHPYTEELVRRLLEGSVTDLQAADTDYVPGATLPDGTPKPVLWKDFFAEYAPDPVVRARPVKDLDFTLSGAYSEYNWELFFHVPLTVAIHLSKNGRYEDALKWFHYVFDPTDNGEGPTPARYWKVRPFQTTDVELIEKILVNLSLGTDAALRDETVHSIDAWKKAPFQPHVVARYRPSAYMFKTVMAYLDNLIAWGDSLFRQDTREAINEATQLYVLAAQILGTRPQEVPAKGRMRPQTYASLQADLDEFGNALRKLETDVPFELVPMPAPPPDSSSGSGSVSALGYALYFGVPRNDKLLAYWDTVADRLFKIRNSLNILGIFRQLPLFDPPIDPALLARAAAAGLDVSAIVSGLNQPLPLVRFHMLVQKATEITQEVKSLGGALLGAMEKHDNEAFQILRTKHERNVLELAESVRYSQWQEAIKAREGIEKTMANVVQRYTYYERQLGKSQSDIQVPDSGTIDAASLGTMKFHATEPELALREIQHDVVTAIQGLPGAYPMSSWEVAELAATVAANVFQLAAGVLEGIGGGLSLVPQIHVRATPWGIGAGPTFGGDQLAKALGFAASLAKTAGGAAAGVGQVAGKVGTYQRRQQDWELQSNLAAGEITQLYKQLRGAQIREAIAEREWHNHQQQIKNVKEVEAFLTDPKTGKQTSQDFYVWMKRELKGLYGRAFEFAYDVARKAERALQQELGDPSLTFLRFDYMGGNEGLLAGERLLLDIKRMEMAYHDLNRREYELTKHVSLLELDPEALLKLRMTGTCTFTVPEEVYDLDGPGHYFRRIRSIALTVPSVGGPYTSVNATLTQLKSSIRINAQLSAGNGDYPREGSEDTRFSDHFGSLESVVTSSGQNDTGLFETNLRDERILPFEGTGAVSEWQIALPQDVRQFDYETIADVLLHVRYTAREGGAVLKRSAIDNLKTLIGDAETLGSVRLFSVRHEFPTEWATFKAAVIDGGHPTASLTLKLLPEHYPFWSKGRIGSLKSLELFADTGKTTVNVTNPNVAGAPDQLTKLKPFGDLRGGKLENVGLPAPIGTFSLAFDDNSMDELWLAAAWGT